MPTASETKKENTKASVDLEYTDEEIEALFNKRESVPLTPENAHFYRSKGGLISLRLSHEDAEDEIFERVWQQESVVSAKTVMVHVSHLRDKIEAATGGEKVIETVWGVGYKVESH